MYSYTRIKTLYQQVKAMKTQSSSINLQAIYQKKWFLTLDSVQQEYFKQSIFLLNDAHTHNLLYYDYSYIVMPASKAYEGYVKDLLKNMGLISTSQYQGKRFRVGKALNPQLEKNPRLKKEALYDELSYYCHDQSLADQLWFTWKECRNQVFHYFQGSLSLINLQHAEKLLTQIIITVRDTHGSCLVEKKHT